MRIFHVSLDEATNYRQSHRAPKADKSCIQTYIPACGLVGPGNSSRPDMAETKGWEALMQITFIPVRLLVALTLLGAFLLGACQDGQITIDIDGGGGDGGGSDTGGTTVSNQTFFILMIVLLVAMFAMVLVAVSGR